MLREIQIVGRLRMMSLPLGNPLVVACVSALTGIGVCVHLVKVVRTRETFMFLWKGRPSLGKHISLIRVFCLFVYLRLI